MTRPGPATRPPALTGDQIAVSDPVDPGAVAALSARVEAASGGGGRGVVIDLRAVSHIDNETLAALCAALRRLSGRDTTLTIRGADPRVRWVLEACRIDRLGLDR